MDILKDKENIERALLDFISRLGIKDTSGISELNINAHTEKYPEITIRKIAQDDNLEPIEYTQQYMIISKNKYKELHNKIFDLSKEISAITDELVIETKSREESEFLQRLVYAEVFKSHNVREQKVY